MDASGDGPVERLPHGYGRVVGLAGTGATATNRFFQMANHQEDVKASFKVLPESVVICSSEILFFFCAEPFLVSLVFECWALDALLGLVHHVFASMKRRPLTGPVGPTRS